VTKKGKRAIVNLLGQWDASTEKRKNVHSSSGEVSGTLFKGKNKRSTAATRVKSVYFLKTGATVVTMQKERKGM